MAKKNNKEISNIVEINPEQDAIDALRSSFRSTIEHQVGAYEKKPGKSMTYVWQADGIYNIQETKLATFIMQMQKCDTKGLPQVLKEGIVLKVPKLPDNIFDEILEFFRFIYKKIQAEVYVRVYYSPSTNSFYYKVPKQWVVGAHAHWEIGDNEDLENSPEDILCIQAHSHHRMNISFSTEDDRDHQTLEGCHMVLFDIFGSLGCGLRFSFGDKKVDLKYEDLFEANSEAIKYDPTKFEGWDTNIVNKSRPDPKTRGSEDNIKTTEVKSKRKRQPHNKEKGVEVVSIRDAKELYGEILKRNDDPDRNVGFEDNFNYSNIHQEQLLLN